MTYILLPVILALGAFLRFYHNTTIALWHDEAFSALYIRYPWPEMIYRIGLDVHPPLYYFLLRIWSLVAGSSLLSLRLFSIVFGVLTIWTVYFFVRAAFGQKKLALLAALFVAINPFQIQYSLEARMYTLGTFLLAFSSYLLVRALDNKKYWLWYGLSVAAMAYTHYYLFFSIAAQGLFLLIYTLKQRNFRLILYGAGAYILALFTYAPWIKTLLAQVGRVEQSYWIPAINRWSLPGTIWKMIFGGQGIRNLILAIATAAALLILYYFIKKVHQFEKWHIIFGVAVPMLCAIVISLKTNLYLDRYFVFSSLYFSILLAVAAYKIPKTFWKLSLIGVFIAASIFAFLKNWDDLNTAGKPGMAGAAAYTNKNIKPSDDIYVNSSFIFFTFKYYNESGIRPRLISDRPAKDIPHFSGTALLTDDDLILNYKQTRKNDTVWLLWTTGFGGAKPEIPTNWKELEEKSFADAPGFKGVIYATKYKIN